MNTIYTIGEALIDFIPSEKGISLKKVENFRRVVGGAPANCAVSAAKLGGRSAFIGKVGKDAFGELIADTLRKCGVDTGKLLFTDVANTALAFVTLNEDGNREFSFYRKPSADMLLNPEEIRADWFEPRDILHFCSVDLIEAPVKYAHKKAIDSVREKGGVVSFDVNLRLILWDNHSLCRNTIREFADYADIIKVSDEEMEFAFGTNKPAQCAEYLLHRGAKAVFITKGADGSEIYTRDFSCECRPYPVKVVDTTGAGDAFAGAMLCRLQQTESIDYFIKPDYLQETLRFANKAGALTTTKKGAYDTIPTLQELAKD